MERGSAIGGVLVVGVGGADCNSLEFLLEEGVVAPPDAMFTNKEVPDDGYSGDHFFTVGKRNVKTGAGCFPTPE